MKRILFLAAIVLIATACSSGSSRKKDRSAGVGRVKDKTFAQQYAALEKQPLQATKPSNLDLDKNETDYMKEREAAAQSERRAQPPLVESNYIFNVMPDKGTYSFDEYNQVWTGERRLNEYKETKRLWNKPKRFRGESFGAAAPAATSPAAVPKEEMAYSDDEGDWNY